jgi:hypothetical protein
LWKEQPSWPSESLIPMPGCTVKKTNRGPMCTFYLCLNKPSKTAKKKKKTRSLELFARGWLWTIILLISASWVGRITDMSHQCLDKTISKLKMNKARSGSIWQLRKIL